ncbi:hypothetical protein WKI65_43285 [Streptomyces sp. MS1.AVA.3]|uniref:hypothetical protein n=1 Tax=Streptomyces decoyicus TaxID=249567 RepID=UPI0030C48D1C
MHPPPARPGGGGQRGRHRTARLAEAGYRSGGAGLALTEITKQLGISPDTLYNHIPDLCELPTGAVPRQLEASTSPIPPTRTPTRSREPALRRPSSPTGGIGLTAQPTGVDLAREAARLARAVAACRTTRQDAEQLVPLGGKLARRTNATWSARQQHRPDRDAPARLPHEPEPGHAPGLAPTDGAAAEVIVCRRGGTGFGRLWTAIGSGDKTEIERAIAKLNDVAVHGPSEFWARGLGD